VFINQSGTYTPVSKVYVNDVGVWKPAQYIWVNNNGTWQPVLGGMPPLFSSVPGNFGINSRIFVDPTPPPPDPIGSIGMF
jgi:hypothetical protein